MENLQNTIETVKSKLHIPDPPSSFMHTNDLEERQLEGVKERKEERR